MIEKEPTILDEFYKFLVKILAPAVIAISIKIATQIKNEQMTFSRVIISFIVGIGCAYFVYPFIDDGRWTPLIVGVVAMSGEKITEYLIYKWDVDKAISMILKGLVNFIVNFLTPKK